MAFFPVDCSILSSVALAEQIVPQYLAPPIGCQLLRHGDNDTYLVEQNGQLSILRVWSHTKHSAAALEAELKLLEHLALHRVSVAPPLKRRNGAYLSVVAAPEGQRWIALFQHAAGTPPGQNITPTQSFGYGRTVAYMHQAFDRITMPYPRPELNLAALLTNPLQTLAPWFGERVADWDFLMTLADVASVQVATVPQTVPFFWPMPRRFAQNQPAVCGRSINHSRF